VGWVLKNVLNAMNSTDSSRKVTIKDVAREAKAGLATVSLALRDDPRITASRRAHIKAVAKALDYHPNPAGAGLAHFKQGSTVQPARAALAWINRWPDPQKLHNYLEFDGYWRGALRTAEKYGYHLEQFGLQHETLPRLEQIISARGIRGILLPPHRQGSEWDGFDWSHFAVVRFGRSIESLPFHLVSADQATNTLLAFKEIGARGYERIGMVMQTIRKHFHFDAGFLKAQLEVEARRRLPLCLLDEENPSAMQTQFERWLKKCRPDAVLTNIPQARDMLAAAGLRVPEDIGLAANSVLDGHADAGIHQTPEEIGRSAVLLLISLLHDNDRGFPSISHELLVKGRWVDGASLPRRTPGPVAKGKSRGRK